ncbi:MAG: IPExxxVDY family protein [Flavobacteriales bacterium]
MALDLFDIKNEVDFEVIALRSVLPEYKLAYHLNQFLGVKLIRQKNDLDLILKNKVVNFATYQYLNEEDQKELYLLKNNTVNEAMEEEFTLFKESVKEEKFFLVPELSEFDFILKIYGYSSEEMVRKIKQISNIQVIKTMGISKIKSIHHLIF